MEEGIEECKLTSKSVRSFFWVLFFLHGNSGPVCSICDWNENMLCCSSQIVDMGGCTRMIHDLGAKNVENEASILCFSLNNMDMFCNLYLQRKKRLNILLTTKNTYSVEQDRVLITNIFMV